MRLVRKRQWRILDPFQIDHSILQRRDRIVHSSSRRRSQQPLPHQRREISRQEQRDLNRYVRIRRLWPDLLPSERTSTCRSRKLIFLVMMSERPRDELDDTQEGEVVVETGDRRVTCRLKGVFAR